MYVLSVRGYKGLQTNSQDSMIRSYEDESPEFARITYMYIRRWPLPKIHVEIIS